MTLTEFLLARIAEDEEWLAQQSGDLEWCQECGFGTQPDSPYSLSRLTIECEVKRRIVEREHVECSGHPGPYMPHGDYGEGYCWRADEQNATLLDLATVYADHPDYREEWKP